MSRGITVETTCKCGVVFYPRVADVNRGWGKFCSKSCKAGEQTKNTGIAGPHYKAAGKTVKQMKSGNYAKSKFTGSRRGVLTNIAYDEWDDEVINGDVSYSHKHGCWIEWEDSNGILDDSHPFDSDAAGFNNT